MPDSRKIATCCYCGTRAVLVMDRARHELACSACGAPLHEMKALPQSAEKKAGNARAGPAGRRRELPEFPREYPRDRHAGPGRGAPNRRHKGKPKRRKPFMRRMLKELWDEVEDIFD